MRRHGPLLLTLVFALACASVRATSDVTPSRPVPPEALLAGNDPAALGAWYLDHGRDLGQACRAFDEDRGADPAALLGAFVCADLRVDDRRLVELGRRLLARDDLHRWSAPTLGYVLVRLGRCPLAGPLADQRKQVLESAYRTGGLPLEVYALEHAAPPHVGTANVLGPFAGPALAAFDRDPPPVGPAVGERPWELSAPFPEWLEPGRYRVRFPPRLEAGSGVLIVLHSRNPVRLLGLAGGPIEVNPPGLEPVAVRYLSAQGTGVPLEADLGLATPDPAFSVLMLPLPSRAAPLACEATAVAGPLGDWACAWLALATGRLDLAEQVLARHPGPAHRLLLAATWLERASVDEVTRRDALLLLTSALEEMPGLSLAHLVLAAAHERVLDLRRALAELQVGEEARALSPIWTATRVALWERASMPAEAARAREELLARWSPAPATAVARLPWQAPPPPAPPQATVDEQLARGVPPSTLAAAWLRDERRERLAATLRRFDTLDAQELLAVLGERTFWDELRTPLDALLGVSRENPPTDAPATVLVQEAIATGRYLYLHRAVRLDSVEGVRRFGEFSPDGAPLVLRARAIKPDHTVVFPETHGSSPVNAFPDLEPGDVIELEWVEEVVPAGGPLVAFRTVSLQDRELRVARCCFSVLGKPDRRPTVDVESGSLWMFEKTGSLVDGTAYSQWCTRRVPPLLAEPDAFQADSVRTHVTLYPWTDDAQALGRQHDDLWRVIRAGSGLRQVADDLVRRYPRDPEGLARAALTAVGERIEPAADTFAGRPAEEAWSIRRGSAADVLLALLRAAGRPARLVLVNPLELERPSAARFSSLDYPAKVVAVDIGRGRVAWLSPSTPLAPWDWLPARLRGRPAWSFGFPGAPFSTRTPDITSEPDLLRIELACERSCKAAVIATGVHRVWLEHELAALTDDAERAAWFVTLLGDLFPLGEQATGVRIDRQADRLRVEGRVTLSTAPDGTIRLVPLTYPEALLRRYAGPASRRFPLLVDADLHVEVSARFDDWRATDAPGLDEKNTFFACHAGLARDDDGVTWTAGFEIRPQIVSADMYTGFRQDLQRVARPTPVLLSR